MKTKIKNAFVTLFTCIFVGGTTLPVAAASPQPTITKEVKEDSTGAFNWYATASYGQEVEYKLTIDVGEVSTLTEDFLIVDEMDKGLTMQDGSIVIQDGSLALGTDGIWLEGTQYIMNQVKNADETTTVTITIPNAILLQLRDHETITITYKAVLNEQARVGIKFGNDNYVSLQHGTYEDDDSVGVHTFQVGVHKFYEKDGKQPLSGAEFTLSTTEGGVETTICSGKTNEKGLLYFKGLDEGDYLLRETKAPDGYALSNEAIPIHISDHGIVSFGKNLLEATDYLVPVENRREEKPKVVSPATGDYSEWYLWMVEIGMVGTAFVMSTDARHEK